MNLISLRILGIVGMSIAMVSCSLFRERTVQDIIDDLPKYDENIPVYWDELHVRFPNYKEIKTMGDLKKALDNGLNPNMTDYHGDHYIEDFFQIDVTSDPEKKKSFLVAHELLLKAGADPQRMSDRRIVTEEEYALHIKYGLDARKPVLYGKLEEYPLTRTEHTITAPIAEWLLAHGADPNQHALHPLFKHLTPLTNLDYIPDWSVHTFLVSIEVSKSFARPEEEVKKTRKVLLKYGARANPS